MDTLKRLFAYLLIVLFISIFFQSIVILFIKYSKEESGQALAQKFQNSFLNSETKNSGGGTKGANHLLKTLSNVVSTFSGHSEPAPEKMVISVQRSSQIEEYRPQVELNSPFSEEKVELKPVKIFQEKNDARVANAVSDNGVSETIDIPYGKKIIFHTLSRGEKLSDLAKLYSVPVDTIKKLNGFSGSYRLFAGQKIMIIRAEGETASAAPLKSEKNSAGSGSEKNLKTQAAASIDSDQSREDSDIDSILKYSKSARAINAKTRTNSAPAASDLKTISQKNTINKSNSNSKEADPLSEIIKSAKNKRRVFKWPVRGVVTSKFGMRLHPVYGKPAMHSGIDIGARKGRPVKPAMGGTVVFAGWLGGYGKLVEIKHPKGYTTRYAHMSAIKVKKGQTVNSSTVIGNVGDTGISTGYHLQFEIRKNGRPLNPAAFIRN